MGEDARQDRQDAAGHPSSAATERVSVPQAADHLGTTVDAIRKRVQRGTIPYEKDADGRVWILLDTGRLRHDVGQDTVRPPSDTDALISEMRGRIEDLQTQLEAERQAHSEARTLLLRALERIPPAIEPPESPTPTAEPSEGAEPRSATGGVQGATERPFTEEGPAEHRSWWRRFFGF